MIPAPVLVSEMFGVDAAGVVVLLTLLAPGTLPLPMFHVSPARPRMPLYTVERLFPPTVRLETVLTPLTISPLPASEPHVSDLPKRFTAPGIPAGLATVVTVT